jgi:hypothetical protein
MRSTAVPRNGNVCANVVAVHNLAVRVSDRAFARGRQ